MRAHLTAIAVVSLTLGSAVADAEPIRLVGAIRSVVAGATIKTPAGEFLHSEDGGDDADNLAGSVLTTFHQTQAQAEIRLVSRISADGHHFSGMGRSSAAVVGPDVAAGGNDFFSLGLEIDQPHAYTFKADLEIGFGYWRGVLAGWSGRYPFDFQVEETGVHHVERRGFIMPGRYDFQIISYSNATSGVFGSSPVSRVSHDFSLDLASVPEPSSLVLVGGGMLTLIAWSRRRIIRSSTVSRQWWNSIAPFRELCAPLANSQPEPLIRIGAGRSRWRVEDGA